MFNISVVTTVFMVLRNCGSLTFCVKLAWHWKPKFIQKTMKFQKIHILFFVTVCTHLRKIWMRSVYWALKPPVVNICGQRKSTTIYLLMGHDGDGIFQHVIDKLCRHRCRGKCHILHPEIIHQQRKNSSIYLCDKHTPWTVWNDAADWVGLH